MEFHSRTFAATRGEASEIGNDLRFLSAARVMRCWFKMSLALYPSCCSLLLSFCLLHDTWFSLLLLFFLTLQERNLTSINFRVLITFSPSGNLSHHLRLTCLDLIKRGAKKEIEWLLDFWNISSSILLVRRVNPREISRELNSHQFGIPFPGSLLNYLPAWAPSTA